METQQELDYGRIQKAIEYLKSNYRLRPSLDLVAEQVNLSPFHFQRMFKEWAGISPKQFLQYLSVEHAKGILEGQHSTLFDVAYETGLSGTGRLHDLFIKIEGMTPGEYKNGGQELRINYSFAESPFGQLIVAATPKGICYLAFADDGQAAALAELQNKFPNAAYRQVLDAIQQDAIFFFTRDWSKLHEIKLHLKGTAFQLKIWEALLKVPLGGLTTYSRLANQADHPKASRAAGSAVGGNPVAFLIPCHRVIRSTGETGQYHWGAERKQAMIGWEAAKSASRP